LDDKNEARADIGRQFQWEGPATEKHLDLAIVHHIFVYLEKAGRQTASPQLS